VDNGRHGALAEQPGARREDPRGILSVVVLPQPNDPTKTVAFDRSG